MTLPTWPVGVPYEPQRDSYQADDPDVISTEVEDGPDIMRVRQQTLVQTIGYTIRMSSSELATFATFVRTTLGQGTSRFTMSVYLPEAGYQTRTCWLRGGKWPRKEVSKDVWDVALTLCVLPS